MKKLCFAVVVFAAMMFATTGCRQTPAAQEVAVDSDTIVPLDTFIEVDSTVYGV